VSEVVAVRSSRKLLLALPNSCTIRMCRHITYLPATYQPRLGRNARSVRGGRWRTCR
jgi:hypothetical protein